MDVRQVGVIRLYDELREKSWHGDDENGHEYEQGAGGHMHSVHCLLQIRETSKDHGKPRYEDEIEHHTAHQTVFDYSLAFTNTRFEYISIAAVLVQEGDVHRDFDHRVADGVGDKTVKWFCFAAQAVQRHVDKVSEGDNGKEAKDKVNGAIHFVMKPLMRTGHVASNNQRDGQSAQIQHNYIHSENAV